MREAQAVLMSDGVNRDRTRFATAEAYRALSANWRSGLPSLLGHDAHRLIGWTLPTFVSIVPGSTRLHGIIYLPETKSEQSSLEAKYRTCLSERIEAETRGSIGELRTLLSSCLHGDEKPHACGGTALIGRDLARRAAPKLFEKADKDGLVDLRMLTPIFPGVYKIGPLVFFAHQFLRRSLSRLNNLRHELLSDLQGLAPVVDANIRIRIDPDLVGLARTVRRTMEMDYWYGPPFKDDLASITQGVTHHEANEFERSYAGISRTEFWWQSRDAMHILEAEELRDRPSFGAEEGVHYGCRYVHSIVDEESGRIVHLDGAIRAYSEEALVARLNSTIAEAGRHTMYTKLWRVDGNVPLGTWKRLIYDFYRDNSLVAEYLDHDIPSRNPTADNEVPVPIGEATPADRIRELVPHSIVNDVGISIALSLWPAPQASLVPRQVEALEVLNVDDSVLQTIDADTLELVKALRRVGADLVVPPGIARIAFQDTYLTLPLIRHDSQERVRVSFAALNELASAWVRRSQADRVFAFTLAFPIPDAELRVAVIARADAFVEHFALFQLLLDCEDSDQRANWTEKVAMALGTSNTPVDTEQVDRLVTAAATFCMKRTLIDRSEFDMHFEGNHIDYSVQIPKEDTALIRATESSMVQPAIAWILTASECSACGNDYASCPCSKYLDVNVTQCITKAEIAYPFWTDRRK